MFCNFSNFDVRVFNYRVKVEPGLSFVIAIPIIVLLFGRWDKECKINYKYIVAIFLLSELYLDHFH